MILAVDGNHLLRTYYHIDKEADPDDIVERFCTRLSRLHDLFSAKAAKIPGEHLRCYVAFDNDGATFRHCIMPGYKSNRTKDPAVDIAVAHAKQAISLSQSWEGLVTPLGCEADDALASLAAQTAEKVVIHSADKDLHQCLVNGRVVIVKKSTVNIEKRQLELEYFSASDLEKKFGITPERWVDYQCLVGDAVDSVIGAEGVGPVAAKAILAAWPGDLKDAPASALPLNRAQAAAWPGFIDRLIVLRSVLGVQRRLRLPMKEPAAAGEY